MKGTCLCGAVRYEVDAEPGVAGHCHCTRCQRFGGGGSQTVAMVPPDTIRFVSGQELVTAYADEGHSTRNFCSRCGTPMYGYAQDIAYVMLATLEPGTEISPQFHIMVDFKAPWEVIGDDLPQFGEFPPMP